MATRTVTQPSQAPQRAQVNYSRQVRQARSYGPTQTGEKVASVGLLEAEFFAIIFLLTLELFVGQDTYGNKMLSFMKRGTMATFLFFLLAMIASVGPNAAKITKAIGALVFFAILLSSPGTTIITTLDNFFKADWTGAAQNAPSSADAGTQGGTSTAPQSAIQQIESDLSGAASKITEIQLPGIGPVVAASSAIDAIKKLFHL